MTAWNILTMGEQNGCVLIMSVEAEASHACSLQLPSPPAVNTDVRVEKLRAEVYYDSLHHHVCLEENL